MLDIWLKKNDDLRFDEKNNSENFIFITCGVSYYILKDIFHFQVI